MGIVIKDYPVDEPLKRKVMMEKDKKVLHIQSGTYDLGRHNIGWSLNLISERIEVTFKLYDSYLQKRFLDRNNPITVFKYAWGYSRIGVKIRASFDDKQLLIDGNVYIRKDSCYEQYIKYDNVIIMNW